MASLVTRTLCGQVRSLSRLHTPVNQNRFASQSSIIQLCLRNFATEKMGLPRVFFDMTADGAPVGRFVVEVCTPKIETKRKLDSRKLYKKPKIIATNERREKNQFSLSYNLQPLLNLLASVCECTCVSVPISTCWLCKSRSDSNLFFYFFRHS